MNIESSKFTVYVLFVGADAIIRPRDDVGIVPYKHPLNNKHRIYDVNSLCDFKADGLSDFGFRQRENPP